MPKFTSEYQQLTVLGPVQEDGVTAEVVAQFEDGVFETDDKDVAAHLRTIEEVNEGGSSGDSLEDKTKAELYEMATEQDIEGRSEMSKGELIEALE